MEAFIRKNEITNRDECCTRFITNDDYKKHHDIISNQLIELLNNYTI